MNAGEEQGEPELAPDPALRKAMDLWPRPVAATDFHQRLRAEFLDAPFEQVGAEELDEADLGPEPVVAPRWGEGALLPDRGAVLSLPPQSRWRKIVAIVAIAAAALLVWRWPTTSGWRVAPTSNYSLARVDGKEFSPKQSGQLAAALEPGSLLEVVGGSLELVLDRRVALSLGPDSVLRLVNVPAPQVLEAILIDQQRGSIAVVTGPEFPGSTLRIRTPDTEVRAVGTEFAVDVIAAQGSCVCCAGGSVQVFERPASDDPGPEPLPFEVVSRGETGFVDKAHATKRGPVIEDHVRPIAVLRQIWADGR
ncbi:MAG TPA: hypothetical protein VK843_22055 [Planctomycetota bacterium]|nr:hypothetical protein [Planctomycetota bacterium]